MQELKYRVRDKLRDFPELRNSDYALWLSIASEDNPSVISLPFSYVITNRKELGQERTRKKSTGFSPKG